MPDHAMTPADIRERAAALGLAVVPWEPTAAMIAAGLYQSSHDATRADVWQAYVDMVIAAQGEDANV